MKNFFTILGGMGTMATESFVHLLNERTPDVTSDQDYFNYLMLNHATMPDRTAFILDQSKTDPGPVLQADVKQIAPLKPDFFVLACNTAHYFYDDMQKLTDIPILHMPRLAVKAILQTQSGMNKKIRVGLLATKGTIATEIYSREIEKFNELEVVLPSVDLQAEIMHLIYHDVKENNFIDKSLYEKILAEMTCTYHCDVMLLGCTELSLVQESVKNTTYPIIDAQAVLVNETIRQAIQTQRSK
ncbi:MAG TPA: amino acid racemase [Tetragenococcus sp.]|nr:amino acid racemase [Tetragenococcus sp.]